MRRLAVWDDYVPRDEHERMVASGYGSEVDVGARPCLLLIDVVLSFLGDPSGDGPGYASACGEEGWRRLPTICALLEAAREAGIPRVLTRGSPRDAPHVGGAVKLSQDPDTARRVHEAPFPAQIVPRDDEYVLEKSKASAFFQTSLLSYLLKQRVDSLIVAGTTTSGCVRASVVDGASYGYPVVVVEDACFDRSAFAHAANLFDIEMKYGTVVDFATVRDRLSSTSEARNR